MNFNRWENNKYKPEILNHIISEFIKDTMSGKVKDGIFPLHRLKEIFCSFLIKYPEREKEHDVFLKQFNSIYDKDKNRIPYLFYPGMYSEEERKIFSMGGRLFYTEYEIYYFMITGKKAHRIMRPRQIQIFIYETQLFHQQNIIDEILEQVRRKRKPFQIESKGL